MLYLKTSRYGGTGRRLGLKIRWEQSRTGSSPVIGTNKRRSPSRGSPFVRTIAQRREPSPTSRSASGNASRASDKVPLPTPSARDCRAPVIGTNKRRSPSRGSPFVRTIAQRRRTLPDRAERVGKCISRIRQSPPSHTVRARLPSPRLSAFFEGRIRFRREAPFATRRCIRV